MYKFVHLRDRVIAISTYAGKIVKADAMCHPEDEFDGEFGEKLAKARRSVKVSKKRLARAKRKYKEAIRQAEDAIRHREKMALYVIDSEKALADAKSEVEILVGSTK